MGGDGEPGRQRSPPHNERDGMPHFDSDKDARLHQKITFRYNEEDYQVIPVTEAILDELMDLGDRIIDAEKEDDDGDLKSFEFIVKQLALLTGAEEAKFKGGELRILSALTDFVQSEIFSTKAGRAARKKRRR